jgi:hypothetical protein
MGLNDPKRGVQNYITYKLEIDWSIDMTVVPSVSE